LNAPRPSFASGHLVAERCTLLRALEPSRRASRRLFGTWLVLLSAGCQGALGLGDYTFTPAGGAAGASAGGAGGDAGAGGSGSPGGDGGSGVNAGAGGDNTAGTAAGGSSSDAGIDGGGEGQECGASGRCVPPIPMGWQGPIVVGAAGGGCPSGYPSALGEVHADFQAGSASCGCNCLLTGVSCHLLSSSQEFFEPSQSCDTPPVADDCLNAVSAATCSLSSTVADIAPSTFQSTRLSCGGAAAASACSGGTCYPSGESFGPVCISAVGDVACPSGFPERALHHQNIADDRSCSTCSCIPQGQACQIEIEVCSVGFYQVTMNEGDACTQLSSSDGDGVTLLSAAVLQQGSCGFSGGVLQGSTAPIDPITVCCME
jgi:hypothetical protein